MTQTTETRARPGYHEAVARFSIQDAMAALGGDLETGLNACVECCDRHTGTGRVALRWTLAGFVALMLAYVGSRFVIEVVLHRAG